MAAAITQSVLAELPKKELLSKYSPLWNDSPFTRKPDPPINTAVNPFEDYTLSAVSPVDGGYFVVLQNKKKPEERKIVKPGSSEFKVVGVRHGTTGPLSTTVTLSDGVRSGEVKFDEKYLTIAKVGSPRNPNQPAQPGVSGQPVQPGQAQQPLQPGLQPARPPRQRIVAPPTPSAPPAVPAP